MSFGIVLWATIKVSALIEENILEHPLLIENQFSNNELVNGKLKSKIEFWCNLKLIIFVLI